MRPGNKQHRPLATSFGTTYKWHKQTTGNTQKRTQFRINNTRFSASCSAPVGARRSECKEKFSRHFFTDSLPAEFKYLRTPYTARRFELTGNSLRLRAHSSLANQFDQSLVARRQDHRSFSASTELLFTPTNDQQCSGLIYFRDTKNFHFIGITGSKKQGRALTIISRRSGEPQRRSTYPLPKQLPIANFNHIELRIEVKEPDVSFSYRITGAWQELGSRLDASNVLAESAYNLTNSFTGPFFGPFIGLTAFDASASLIPADFKYFEYKELHVYARKQRIESPATTVPTPEFAKRLPVEPAHNNNLIED